MKLTEQQRACLEALDTLTHPDGERCAPFLPIQNMTNYDRRLVRVTVRQLKRKGLAEYHRGLVNEMSDEFAGAGYCITKEGRVLQERRSEQLAAKRNTAQDPRWD